MLPQFFFFLVAAIARCQWAHPLFSIVVQMFDSKGPMVDASGRAISISGLGVSLGVLWWCSIKMLALLLMVLHSGVA